MAATSPHSGGKLCEYISGFRVAFLAVRPSKLTARRKRLAGHGEAEITANHVRASETAK